MRARVYKMAVSGVVAVLIATLAAPGLTLHNCRQFGTRSTQLCGCCETEANASGGCCAPRTEQDPAICHSDTDAQSTEANWESSCCFTSYEGPFSFDGHGSLQIGLSAPTLEIATLGAICIPGTPSADLPLQDATLLTRHSSDPPSYVLTHSFRC